MAVEVRVYDTYRDAVVARDEEFDSGYDDFITNVKGVRKNRVDITFHGVTDCTELGIRELKSHVLVRIIKDEGDEG